MSDITQTECRRLVEQLSPQLRSVLVLMASGLATKQIADEMALSQETVKTYRERVYSRLRVNNLASATRVAVYADLI